ncbi:hypothetical protein [Nonomuraea sp. WAC 01424]|uniref:hypothetical protein n=1 Tax=Nonomuraea sp. WAC 01424 TaxID=2203200 RepID=UPI00163C608A|nr:hypothetical protein [Nonomuraea sp. WAC 01424]
MSETPSLAQLVEDVRTLGEPYVRGVGTALGEVVAAFKGAADQLIATKSEQE